MAGDSHTETGATSRWRVRLVTMEKRSGRRGDMALNTRVWFLAVAVLGVIVLGTGLCFAEPAQTQSASALGNDDPRKQETSVGDLVADAVRAVTAEDVARVATTYLSENKRSTLVLIPK